MVASWITSVYILLRVSLDIFQVKSKEKFSPWKILIVFAVFSSMIFLVFLEVYVITDLLVRQFSSLFSISFSVFVFVFGYEISNMLFDKFYAGERKEVKKALSLKTFFHYFYNSFFGLIFLIIASFTLLYL
jgi:uncharacterized membrane protein YbhN (UPF0104 family)